MKASTATCIALVALACFLPSGLAQNDAFEDCATTTFKIANNRVYSSADVFKYTKLKVGQGTMDCMALCRANDECWSFNFDKTKKWCYLISEEGSSIRNRRRMLWSSGYKVCVAHSDDSAWDNTPTDQAVLKPENFQAVQIVPTIEAPATVHFSWDAAAGTSGYDGNKVPTYRVICGQNDADWHCDETGNGQLLFASAKTTAIETTEDLSSLDSADLAGLKCFVETYVNDIKVACSNSDAIAISVVGETVTIARPGPNSVAVTFAGNSAYKFRVACYPGAYTSCQDDEQNDVTLGSWVTGAWPATTVATIPNLADGAYTCFLRIKDGVTNISQGCSAPLPVVVA